MPQTDPNNPLEAASRVLNRERESLNRRWLDTLLEAADRAAPEPLDHGKANDPHQVHLKQLEVEHYVRFLGEIEDAINRVSGEGHLFRSRHRQVLTDLPKRRRHKL